MLQVKHKRFCRRMASPPNEKGIMNAMKSMKTIAGKDSFKDGLTPKTMAFPSPPRDLVGTMESTKKTRPNFSTKKNKKTPPPNVTGTRPKKKSSLPPPPPPAATATPSLPPPPLTKPDTNSQLFGTLLNSLKTGPVSQMNSVRPSKTGKTGKTKKKITQGSKNQKKTKGYASSSSSSSMSSVSTSSSRPSSTSSASSEPSSCSDTLSLASSGSCSSGGKSGKLKIEKKKRKEELLHEKVEMLTRIANLSKNGFTTTKQWDVKDDIDEVRYECYRMQRESNSKKSIKIMRRVLVTITTLVETGNAYFNPFNLRLDGFSESMMLNLDDYDDCFEQIHHKYSGRSSVGPEMQILFTFMSAAIFHHAGNAIGQKRDGATNKKRSTANPMSSVMSMMGMINANGASRVNSYPMPRSTPPPQTSTGSESLDASAGSDGGKPKRKTMRGPGASMMPDSILGAGNSNKQTTPSMTLPV
ncbi:EsV-1-103 [Ectocarpus siliculosus]|uniref:EsV-1-103 n=1 Tax=Ectocarpus siliculosus TaxID=2880 RepID=D8LPD4_ECTSI|nr:EsV-1-103 [Ectocarpus siliculosus]|eukprot:CBN80405.1 EsV-1-103 [Ectocarpus siliculosus]